MPCRKGTSCTVVKHSYALTLQLIKQALGILIILNARIIKRLRSKYLVCKSKRCHAVYTNIITTHCIAIELKWREKTSARWGAGSYKGVHLLPFCTKTGRIANYLLSVTNRSQ